MNVFNKNDLSIIGEARKLAEEVFGKGCGRLGYR
jgi:hypothetical protein